MYTKIKKNITSLFLAGLFLSVNSCDKNEPAPPIPVINSLNPNSGPEGTVVTINGQNFSSTVSENVVKFNNVNAIVSNATPTQLVTTVPAGATTGLVTVSVNNISANNGLNFTVIPTPVMNTLSPNNGQIGTTVTITGLNFSSNIADNTIKFNNINASITSATSTQLVTTVPQGLPLGVVTVSLIVNGINSSNTQNFTVTAPPAASIDNSFNIGTGANGTINCMTLQPDGKILIGGAFTSFNGISQGYIARLNSNGSLDNTFNTGTGFNNNVLSIIIQSDGKVLVGGEFTSFNGNNRNYIVRLNSNGSLDTGFDIGTGTNKPVRAIAMHIDNKILIGGDFENYNGNLSNGLARLNTTGNFDDSFDVGQGFEYNGGCPTCTGLVRAVLVRPDNSIYVGGGFTKVDGILQSYTQGLTANGAMSERLFYYNNVVNGLELLPSGKILVGGAFTSIFQLYNTQNFASQRIGRLETNLRRDESFAILSGINDAINTMSSQSDSKIIVGGKFTSVTGSPRNNIARLQSFGEVDDTFVSNANGIVMATLIQPDGKILIAGGFTNYNNTNINRIVRVNP